MVTRAYLLITVVGVALLLAACGRASRLEIDQALGITPTPTRSAAEIAAATSSAAAASTARALASVGSPAVAAGDVALGLRQYNTWCIACHPAGGGRGPDLLSAGSPGTGLAATTLTGLIREGTGTHQPTYKTTEISDKQIVNLAAYIRSLAGE